MPENKPYWDRRINIAHRSINRKKYYGLGVEIEKYQDVVEDAVNVEEITEILRNAENFRTQEDLVDKVTQLVNLSNPGTDQGLFAEIQGVFEDSFQKGTRRLFTKDGDRIEPGEGPVNQDAVNQLMQDQDEYFENLHNDVTREIESTLRDGMNEGKSINELADEVEQQAKSVSRNRAETIARSELTKASAEGTKATMERAGIQKFMWLSARNDNVCTSGSFQTNIDGQTFTSCRELDGTTWDKDMNHPLPVEDSHPNCRCTLVADTS